MGENEGSGISVSKYFSEHLISGNKESNVGIISLWTQKESIAEGLDKNTYASIGQLYSKTGINALIRNIYSNPKIRYVIICGADKSGSGEALLKFSNEGIDDTNHIIGTDNTHIDEEIPREDIDKFRHSVEIIDMMGVVDTKKIQEKINSLEKKEPFTEPKEFPEKKLEVPERFPSDGSVFKVRARTIGKAWLTMLSKVMRFGFIKQSHHSPSQKEVLNMIAVITEENPDNIQWYDFFNFSQKDLEEYYPQVLSADKIPGINYTYGQRLMDHNGVDQIKSIIEKLKKEPFTRRAIAVTWDVNKDVDNDNAPCLNLINFLVQDDKLYMNTYFRSHDIYRAWPRNAFALRKLQKRVSDETGIKMGSLTIFSSSAHIYEESIPEVNDILNNYYKGKEHEWDPRSNLVIKIEGDELIISHYSQEGKKLDELRGKSALELFHVIDKHHVISQTMHALDIGSELRKAEIALKNGLEYNQDNPLILK
ncbi:thymidylate synthase [candidate division KSB1 bacterium]